MNKKIEELLHNLRRAIDEALADSPIVAAIMAELDQLGLSPAFAVDIELPEAPEAPFLEMGPLSITLHDEQFLKNIGIQTYELTDAAGC